MGAPTGFAMAGFPALAPLLAPFFGVPPESPPKAAGASGLAVPSFEGFFPTPGIPKTVLAMRPSFVLSG
jgi:hypothetical protein